jgi:hypothetical protein
MWPLTFLLLLSTLDAQLSNALAQGTAFTYQGRLNDGANPAHGTYDFRFKLFADVFGNTQAGSTVLTSGVPMTNGLFTVTIDFGTGIFNGSNYWLEVDVRTNGGGGYANLNPLQAVTPSPYAIFANTASNLSGTISSANLSGAYAGAVTFNNGGNSFSGSFSGNGSNVTNASAATLGGLGANQFWKTTGNSNTVAGTNFLGTTDNQPLELWSGGVRVLRLEPDPRGNSAGNLVGGFINNTVEQPNSGGDVIGGGGYFFGPNIIHSNSSGVFIGAGSANQIGPNINDSFIGAGFGNTIKAIDSVIGGGSGNTIQASAASSFIGGGNGNLITTGSVYSVTAGGLNNTNTGGYSVIGGGTLNSIQDANYSFIGGGFSNTVQSAGNTTTIAGGAQNRIGTNAQNATISGGVVNTIGNNANSAAIGGGSANTIQTNANFSIIGGGSQNTIQSSGIYATIPGGSSNLASGQYSFAAGLVAQANHNGAFVWSDASSFTAFASTGTNQFSVRATGGVRFVTGGAGMTLDGQAVLTPGALSNVALLTGGNAFTGQQTINGGNVGIGTASPGRLLQVGDSSVASSEGMIHLGSRSASGLSLRDWELGVPQTGDFVTGEGYSFVVRDTTASANARLIIKWGTGNVGIGTSAPGHLLQVGANVSPPYCDGLTWVNGSDRNAKENFKSVDAREVLAKVAALPLSRWNYKEDKSNEHLGPMAQDFHASFGLNGADDTHIATLDEEGVALAAIQGLNQKVDSENARLREELKRRDAENAELRQRLEAVEKIIRQQKLN